MAAAETWLASKEILRAVKYRHDSRLVACWKTSPSRKAYDLGLVSVHARAIPMGR